MIQRNTTQLLVQIPFCILPTGNWNGNKEEHLLSEAEEENDREKVLPLFFYKTLIKKKTLNIFLFASLQHHFILASHEGGSSWRNL